MQDIDTLTRDDRTETGSLATLTETSDAPADSSTGYVMSPGDIFQGTLDVAGDRDWVAIELTAGETYEISLTGSPSGNGTLDDPTLRVYDENGYLVVFNDDGGLGYESFATFTPTTSGTYYISAGAYSDISAGTYQIEVTERAPAPAADLDTLADYLTDGYWQDNFSSGRAFDMSSDNIITVNLTGLTPEGQQLARWALAAWEAVADIDFQETTGAADITFDDDDSGAYSTSTTSGGTIISSHVNISTNWIASYGTTIDSYSFQTYVHEIGHALGLGHQGSYNGAATYGVDETFANDSWQVSIMSYFSQTDNTTINASYALLGTAMMADIVAIQNLYGAPGGSSVTAGNTTYGANTNLGGQIGAVFAAIAGAPVNGSMITGDPLAATIYDRGGTDTIDLSTTTANNRLDLRDGRYSDIGGLIGNLGIARGTIIENAIGGSGNDDIRGNAADNVLRGNDGADTLRGGGGNDKLVGGGDNDTLKGQAGDDLLKGNLGADKLLGNAGADTLKGGGGNDTLVGGGGNDTLRGQADDDLLKGANGNDKLLGNAGADTLKGGGGNDTLVGGGDNDKLLGNGGADTLRGGGGNDTLAGGSGNDKLLGNAGGDVLRGGNGRDTLNGGNGDDTLNGGGWGDTLIGGAGDDLLTGGDGPDVFRFNTGAQTGNDTVTDFDNGTDLIRLDGASFDDLTITQFGGNTVITWDNGSVTLTGETGVINEDDFVFG